MCPVPSVHSQCHGESDSGTVHVGWCRSSVLPTLPTSQLTENNVCASSMTHKASHNLARHSVSKPITQAILCSVTRAQELMNSMASRLRDSSLLFSLTSSQIGPDQSSTFLRLCFHTTLPVRTSWTTSYSSPYLSFPRALTPTCLLPLLSRLRPRPPLDGKPNEPPDFCLVFISDDKQCLKHGWNTDNRLCFSSFLPDESLL